MIRGASFAARMAFVLALALLVAQAVNFTLLYEARERVRIAKEETLIARFVVGIDNDRAIQRIRERPRRRAVPISITNSPVAALGEVDEELTERLREKLKEDGQHYQTAQAARMMRPHPEEDRLVIVMSAQLDDGQWFNASAPAPRSGRLDIRPLILQTGLIFIGLLAATLLVTAWLSRPLRRLTEAADRFRIDSRDMELPEAGPDDIGRLTAAFGRMRDRLRRAFTEKDAMLGAIGHDLRTPLTSLRIRVEQVENEALRERMIGSIDELSTLLEDILVLARDGAPGTDREEIDLRALYEGLAADLTKPETTVSAEEGTSVMLGVYPALLRRALRNLIENGQRYGGNVTLRILSEAGSIVLAVDDDGQGVPEDQLARLREPFERGEGSRNRETGGAGLGLAIADGAARAHGGSLELANRPEGGFRAAMRLPLSSG